MPRTFTKGSDEWPGPSSGEKDRIDPALLDADFEDFAERVSEASDETPAPELQDDDSNAVEGDTEPVEDDPEDE